MAKWWQQALSFGAAGRIEEAAADYSRVLAHARQLAAKVEARRAEVGAILAELVSEKRSSLRVLGQIRLISRNLGLKERKLTLEATEEPPEVSVARIESTLDAAAYAKSAAKGIAAGASTAMGAWALVGTFGSASTATALATLSGAAAQSATLAWFGGGSLATGGAGAAGGATVLGGIVAVPALAVMAYLAHSKANKQIAKITLESAKLEKAMDDMMKLELIIDLAEQRARELTSVVSKAREAFENRFRLTYRRLYPWGWFSRAWRWLRKRLGINYFTTGEMKDVQGLLQVAAEFAHILDQKVFDADGSVRKEVT
jgi:hypothetical protein